MLSLLLSCLLILAGCGTKKNTPLSRNWQAFTTRYNVFFNGNEHYKEQISEMEKKYEDDYSRTLMTHPAEARGDEKLPQPTGDFKRTIEKMQKAIQLHSIKKKPKKKNGSPKEKAFRAREEFNPFLHNAWMTMGRAQFMNGDFLGAASTFLYISKHFSWLPATVTEAKIWQARCYCALDWAYEAENILGRIKPAELTGKTLENLYNITQADYLVRTERWKEAIPYLEKAAKAAKGSQKNRLYFLLGQACRQIGDNKNAYTAFRKAGSGASTLYRTKFNARIKQSEVFTGSDIRKEVKSLRAMARYQRNNEFLDQIYYAIGNLYMSRGDSAEAKKNYLLAVEKSTRNGIDKALANLALGGIYFSEHDYVKAQPCYSEAIPLLPENYPDFKQLKKRSDVLDELATYSGNVQLQDSLLDLSKLSEEEQLKVCQRLAEELIKKEKEAEEAAKREEYLAEQQGKGTPMDKQSPVNSFQVNNDKSWYFYNTMAKNQGKNEFQRKWGSRKLEDDWRRRNKTSFSFGSDEEESAPSDSIGGKEGEPLDSAASAKKDLASDPHNAEYYMAQIPRTPDEIRTAEDVIQEGLYNMGVILKDKLEDFPASRSEFDRLLTRFPDNTYRLEVYYNLYLMAVRDDNAPLAEKWRATLMAEFPDSPYAKAMADPDYFNRLRQMHQFQEGMYAETYAAYLADDNPLVHQLTQKMEADYPLSPILPKFVFIDALSYLTQKDYAKFRERLEELLKRWPDTDMTDMAGAIVRGLQAGRVPSGGGSNARGMLWETRLSSSDNATSADGQPANFERDPASPQYLVFAFPRDSVSPNQVLYDVARFNFSSFVVKDFDLEQMSFGNIGLLIVKGFANLRELEHYRDVMARSTILDLPPSVLPIMISKPNFELLLREGRSFEEYFNFEEKAEAEATEKKVLEEETEVEEGEKELSEEFGGQPEEEPAEVPEETPETTPEPGPENAPATEEEVAPAPGEEEETPVEN